MGNTVSNAMCGFHAHLLEDIEPIPDSRSSSHNEESFSLDVQLEQPCIQRTECPPIKESAVSAPKFIGKEMDIPKIPEKKACHSIETIDLSLPGASERVQALILEWETPPKTRLIEICAANSWAFPVFKSHEKGEGFDKMFCCSCEVLVKMEGKGCTLLECVGEAKSRKKAAEDHAAEGALWYLKHLGYH